jgi:DNA-binding protein HU-beta
VQKPLYYRHKTSSPGAEAAGEQVNIGKLE